MVRWLWLVLGLLLIPSIAGAVTTCPITGNLKTVYGGAAANTRVFYQSPGNASPIIPGANSCSITTTSMGTLPTSGNCTAFIAGAQMNVTVGLGEPVRVQVPSACGATTDLSALILANTDPPSVVSSVAVASTGDFSMTATNPGTGVIGTTTLTPGNVIGFEGVPLTAGSPLNGQGYFFNQGTSKFVLGTGPAGNPTVISLTAADCTYDTRTQTGCTVSINASSQNFTITSGTMPCPGVVGHNISIFGAGTGTLNQQGTVPFIVTAPLTTTVASCSDSTHGTVTLAAGTSVTSAPTQIGADNRNNINTVIASAGAYELGPGGAVAYISNGLSILKSYTTLYLNGVKIVTPWMAGMTDGSGTNAFDILRIIGGGTTSHIHDVAIVGPGVLDSGCGNYTAGSSFFGSVSEQNYCNNSSGSCDPVTAIYQPSNVYMRYVNNVLVQNTTIQNSCSMGLTTFEDAQYIFSVGNHFDTIGADAIHFGESYTGGDSIAHVWSMYDSISNNNDDGVAIEGGYNNSSGALMYTTDGHIDHLSYNNPTSFTSAYFNDGIQFTGAVSDSEATEPIIVNPPETGIQLIDFNCGAPQRITINGGEIYGGVLGFMAIQITGRGAGSTSSCVNNIPGATAANSPTIQNIKINNTRLHITNTIAFGASTVFQGRCAGTGVCVSGNVSGVDIGDNTIVASANPGTGVYTQAGILNWPDDVNSSGNGCSPPNCSTLPAGSTHRTNIFIHDNTLDMVSNLTNGFQPTPQYNAILYNADIAGDSYYTANNFIAGKGTNNLIGTGQKIPWQTNVVPNPNMAFGLVNGVNFNYASGSATDWFNGNNNLLSTWVAGIGGSGGNALQVAGSGSPALSNGVQSPCFTVQQGQVYTQSMYADFTAGSLTQSNQNPICMSVNACSDGHNEPVYGLASSSVCEYPGHVGWQAAPVGPMDTSSVYVSFFTNGATWPAGTNVILSDPGLTLGQSTGIPYATNTNPFIRDNVTVSTSVITGATTLALPQYGHSFQQLSMQAAATVTLPLGAWAGQGLTLLLCQPSGGNAAWTIAEVSGLTLKGPGLPSSSTGANKCDLLGFQYYAPSVLLFTGFEANF